VLTFFDSYSAQSCLGNLHYLDICDMSLNANKSGYRSSVIILRH